MKPRTGPYIDMKVTQVSQCKEAWGREAAKKSDLIVQQERLISPLLFSGPLSNVAPFQAALPYMDTVQSGVVCDWLLGTFLLGLSINQPPDWLLDPIQSSG